MPNITWRTGLYLLGLTILLIGLVLSRAMMSIGMMLLVVPAFFQPEVGANFRKFLRAPGFWLPMLVFLPYLLSGLWSEDQAMFWQKVQLRLPFLILPFAFYSFEALSKQMFRYILLGFVLLMTVSGIIVLIDFLQHYREVVDQYLHAKTIDTPFNHIRYSLMVAFAIVANIYLITTEQKAPLPLEKWLVRACLAFLVIFIHVLSVRSGIAALYLVLFYLAIAYIRRSGRKKLGWVLLIVLFMIPTVAYVAIPTLRNKVTYMVRDLRNYSKGNSISRFSDGRRLVSLKAGIEIGNRQPLIGVGVGDVEQEVYEYYQENYPLYEREFYIVPHNQLVFAYAATGIIGVLLLIGGLLPSLFLRKAHRFWLFTTVHIMLWASFLVEPTFETQLGIAFFLIFYLLTLRMAYNELQPTTD